MKKYIKFKRSDRMRIVAFLLCLLFLGPIILQPMVTWAIPAAGGLVDPSGEKKTLDEIITGGETKDNSKDNAFFDQVADSADKATGAEKDKIENWMNNTPTASGASRSSWVKNESNDKIYKGDGEVMKIQDKDDDSDPGIFEGLMIALFVNVSNWFNNFFKNVGMSLDSIILGRVGGHGVSMNGYTVSLFTFEMRPGNPYGIVASAAYSVVRGIVYALVAVIVFAKVAAASYAGGSQKALNTLKDAFSSFIVAILMLTLMPYLVDVLLYIRDVFLYAVATNLGTNLLGLNVSDLSIVQMFKDIAEDSFMNAAMYLGTVILTLWFAMQYVGLAMSFVVYFFAFPFVCINMQMDKRALGEWWKNIGFSMLIPVADLLLMFIPLAFGILGKSAPVHVLQFLVCTMLLPARAQLRSAIGIRTNMGMELAGMATMIGAMNMARSAVGGAVGITSKARAGFAAANQDRQMGNMYDDIATAQTARVNNFQDMYNQSNGYGIHSRKKGDKEIEGVDSLSSGISGLSQAYGLPTGAFGDGYNDDKSAILPSSGSFGGNGSNLMNADQDILEKYANVSNFENPEFKNLSAERKAELYKKRSLMQTRRTLGSLAGGVAGGVAGGALGVGASTFLSAGAKMQTVGMGIAGGIGAGEAAGTVAQSATALAGRMTAGAVAKRATNVMGQYSAISAVSGATQPDIYQNGYGIDASAVSQAVAQAEQEYEANMENIENVQNEALTLNDFTGQLTDPSNQTMRNFMDETFDYVNSMDLDAAQKQSRFAEMCVSHAMDLSDPYIKNNVEVKNDNGDQELVNKLIERTRTSTMKRYKDNFSPENIVNYGNGKYQFK